MRSFLLTVSVVTIFSSALCGADERRYPNLVYNPGFEDLVYSPAFSGEAIQRNASINYINEFEFWSFADGVAACSDSAHTGKRSMRITGPSTGEVKHLVGYYVYDTNPGMVLEANREYELCAFVKSTALNGQGVKLIYRNDAGETLASCSWTNESSDWKKHSASFVTPADARTNGGSVRILWQLAQDDIVYIDDVCLKPKDGRVPAAPPPAISPAGGTFEGPVMVSMHTPLPGAVIQYTVDGSEPTRFSVLYRGPFLIDGPVTLHAKVFHSGYRDASASAEFAILPKVNDGVPFYPTGWGQDVETWYSNHIYNPKSPQHFEGPVVSPEPRINIAEILKKHPESETAGIEEALAIVPKSGGTLWFPKEHGPYTMKKRVSVVGRSNLHFLSDGAQINVHQSVMRVNSKDSTDWHSFVLNPVRNYYFNNLIFDGLNQGSSGFFFQHCVDILFDNCTFRNFDSAQRGRLNGANVNVDNFWYRDCTFSSNRTGFATYWDGVHNAGVLNCKFIHNEFGGGNWLCFANNDMSPFCAFERSGQYLVFDGNTIIGDGYNGFTLTAANVLLINNTFRGKWHSFLHHEGRGKSNTQPRMLFCGSGLRVINNDIKQADTFIIMKGDMRQNNRPDNPIPTVIRDNQADQLDAIMYWNPVNNPHFPPHSRLQDITFKKNTFTGTNLPQVVIQYGVKSMIEKVSVNGVLTDFEWKDPDMLERISNIRFIENTLQGHKRALVVNPEGIPIETDAFRWINNQFIETGHE